MHNMSCFPVLVSRYMETFTIIGINYSNINIVTTFGRIKHLPTTIMQSVSLCIWGIHLCMESEPVTICHPTHLYT